MALLCLLGAAFLLDLFLLFSKKGIEAERFLPKRFSNGDPNGVSINLKNNYRFGIDTELIDEIPFQFQRRDINWKVNMPAFGDKLFQYELTPVKRGVYSFGDINVFAITKLGLISRRYRIDMAREVAVYPSFLQMRKYELAAFTNRLQEYGIKRIRRLGHSSEFEQIKEYVSGDDPRFINWKATARSSKLMVNQFIDERSQPVYAIIDKGRMMKHPFEGMTLLDYAINASLVILNIALKKSDKAGLVTFSNKMSSVLPANKKTDQIYKIQEMLYAQKTHYKESNFEVLSMYLQRTIRQRSLFILFTNFEGYGGFKRQQKYLRSMSKYHLVLVVFFQNTGIKNIIESDPVDKRKIYHQVIAEQSSYEMNKIKKELTQSGIYSILTTPQELTIDTINKYLELKAMGKI